jgi:hypothetical protein
MIEKNVPIPPKAKPGRPAKYKFDEMVVGDSFRAKALYQTLYVAVRRFIAKPENSQKTFVIRPSGKEHVRVWREA